MGLALVVGPADDPVLVRRARMQRLALVGQRVGYALMAVSVVSFVVGIALGLPSAAVRTVIISLVLSCVVLPPAIILGFAVRAADREDREGHAR